MSEKFTYKSLIEKLESFEKQLEPYVGQPILIVRNNEYIFSLGKHDEDCLSSSREDFMPSVDQKSRDIITLGKLKIEIRGEYIEYGSYNEFLKTSDDKKSIGMIFLSDITIFRSNLINPKILEVKKDSTAWYGDLLTVNDFNKQWYKTYTNDLDDMLFDSEEYKKVSMMTKNLQLVCGNENVVEYITKNYPYSTPEVKEKLEELIKKSIN